MAGNTLTPMEKRPIAEQRKLDQLLTKWHEANENSAHWRATETELRNQIAATFFPNCPEGTNTLPLPFGKALKCGVKITRSVSEAELEAVRAKAALEKNKRLLSTIDKCFVYKPSLRVGAWKDIDDELLIEFADVVTEKPGTPSLEIVTPKR